MYNYVYEQHIYVYIYNNSYFCRQQNYTNFNLLNTHSIVS